MGKYFFGMFILCFFVWAVVVDNVIVPSLDNLKQDVGAYTRYRLKEWDKGGKLDLLEDELLVYAIVDNREQLYYIDYKPHFEQTLKYLQQGTPVQLRYVNAFPKFWKRQLYEIRSNGIPVMTYSSAHLILKQEEIWKFTGIMGGVYGLLLVLGLINRPRRR